MEVGLTRNAAKLTPPCEESGGPKDLLPSYRCIQLASRRCAFENLHREDVQLDEGVSYQRLVSAGRTIDEVAAAVGKSKGYGYQRISVSRLVPKVQDLLARDLLAQLTALVEKTVRLNPQ